MRILWLNWRDIRNPLAGGAEVFTHQIAMRLAKKFGYEITLFSSFFPGAIDTEKLDGIKIVRRGSRLGVYKEAKHFYKTNSQEFDLVIDEINTRPFLTPTFVHDAPIIAIIHQLAREFWFYETPFPINFIGYLFLENHWLRKYREIPTLTVSNSTKNDLLKLGFLDVQIIPEGLGFKPLTKVQKKEADPTLIFVGRLVKAKRPWDVLKAFKIIEKQMPNAKLWIIGDGYLLKDLEQAVQNSNKVNARIVQLGEERAFDMIAKSARPISTENTGLHSLNNFEKEQQTIFGNANVKFFGKITETLKLDLMSRAHILLVPGVREGWGLVVTEANASGTPVIVYDVPGLRDSVSHGKNGIIVPKNNYVLMAKEALRLLQDPTLLEKFSLEALEYSRQFDWDKATNAFAEIVVRTLKTRLN